MWGPNRKFEQIHISSYLAFSIQYLVLEGMHRCICSFNLAISEIRGSESDNREPGFAPNPKVSLESVLQRLTSSKLDDVNQASALRTVPVLNSPFSEGVDQCGADFLEMLWCVIDTTGQPVTALLMGATALPDISPNSIMKQVAQETQHEVLVCDPPDCHHC